MKFEGSLLRQETATESYPEVDESNLHFHSLFLELHFNIILQSTLRFSKWYLPSVFSIVYWYLTSTIHATRPEILSTVLMNEIYVIEPYNLTEDNVINCVSLCLKCVKCFSLRSTKTFLVPSFSITFERWIVGMNRDNIRKLNSLMYVLSLWWNRVRKGKYKDRKTREEMQCV
jgi:hypothetical protein